MLNEPVICIEFEINKIQNELARALAQLLRKRINHFSEVTERPSRSSSDRA